MKPQFTPGPWYVEGYTVTIDNDMDVQVQRYTVTSVMRHIAGNDSGLSELVANAHLIAAAPEMYHALSYLHDYFYSETGGIPEELRMADDIAKILAKARGEQ